MNILYAVLWFLLLGGLFGFLLAFLNRKLSLPEEGKGPSLRERLPGANCGGCGFSGCDAMADALAHGKASPADCPVLSDEERRGLFALLGLPEEKKERLVACVFCSGGEKAQEKYDYEGIPDCRIAARLAGGNKLCAEGCTGLGNCTRVCDWNAIELEKGVARVKSALCRGCGACVRACPKGIIRLVPASAQRAVVCSSHAKGPVVLAACDGGGCIGCRKCEKLCPVGAVTVKNSLAVIDPRLCTGCGACETVCPRGVIHRI